ncbi:MAG: hypothetical protein AAF430_06050 [Myxococcota bacterium]
MGEPRSAWNGPEPGERVSAVPRWLAVVMLVVFLVAGGCSAWLLVSGDFDEASGAAPPSATTAPR